MLTLAQRVISDGLQHSGSPEDKREAGLIRDFIMSSHKVIIDNCYHYVRDNNDTFKVKDLPSVMPFYDKLWFEYTRDDRFIAGVLVDLYKMNFVDVEDSEYLLEVRIVFHNADCKSPVLVPVVTMFNLDSMGKICESGSQLYTRSSIPGKDVDDESKSWCAVLSKPVMFALSLCHVMNVKEQDVSDKYNPRAKELKRTGQPKLTYKVLEIEPAKKVLREVGHVATEGIAKALHTVQWWTLRNIHC